MSKLDDALLKLRALGYAEEAHAAAMEVDALRAALKPFVEHKRNNVLAYDSEPVGLTMGDLRAALKALGEKP